MFQIFLDFFGNILNDVILLIFLLVGILVGLLFKPKAKNRVIKLLPRDKRFLEFKIEEESAVGILCEPKKGYPLHRFIKLLPGYTGIVGRFLKRAVTLYFGKEGTAYTWRLKSKLKQEIGSLAKALQMVWGEEFYNLIPEDARQKVEESKINVTVNLDDADLAKDTEGKDLPVRREEDIKTEEDRVAAQTYWEGKAITMRKQWLEYLFIAGFGFGVALALQIIGVLRI